MDSWLQVFLVSITSVIGSSGFWAYMQRRDRVKNATARLVMGLAYDQIATRGMEYIDRGWVTKDEYEEFMKYFYTPYKALGGNGVAEQIVTKVRQLPLRTYTKYKFPQETDNVRVISRAQEAVAE